MCVCVCVCVCVCRGGEDGPRKAFGVNASLGRSLNGQTKVKVFVVRVILAQSVKERTKQDS